MALIGAIAGGMYTSVIYLSRPDAVGSVVLGVCLGALIGTGISLFESVFVARPNSRIRQLPFWLSMLIRAFAASMIIMVARLVAQMGYQFFTGDFVKLTGESQRETITDVGFSLVVISILIIMMQMRNFVGGTTFKNLIFGRYNRPRIEDRIFLIIDVVGATKLAQEIGDVQFHKYLNRIFVLLDDPIHKHGGEVHSYVGDAIFAVWPADKNGKNNRKPLEALAAMIELLNTHRQHIEDEYGVAPQIRAALHKGPVVTGETGYRKRQITFLGNTVNLASRIESLTKTGIGTYLASIEYLGELELPEGLTATPIGEFDVKGSSKPVSLFRLDL